MGQEYCFYLVAIGYQALLYTYKKIIGHEMKLKKKNLYLSSKCYKCIGIELDLFPQLTTKHSLYVYYCKR